VYIEVCAAHLCKGDGAAGRRAVREAPGPGDDTQVTGEGCVGQAGDRRSTPQTAGRHQGDQPGYRQQNTGTAKTDSDAFFTFSGWCVKSGTYTPWAIKNVPLYFCPYLRQLLTDFQFFFTATLCRQFAIM